MLYISAGVLWLLFAAERRGTPVLLSASVSDSGNSPQMAAPRRSRERDQSTQAFMLFVIIDVYLAMNMADYMDVDVSSN